MKVTLTGVWHNAKNKAGVEYKNKDGKPYERCSIKVTEYGDKYLSGFGNQVTKGWSVGDEIDILIEEKGEFINFSLPKKEAGMSDMDRETLRRIEQTVTNTNTHVMRIYKHLGIEERQTAGNTDVPYPEYTGEVDFNPEDKPF